jgi:polyhydroxybutyrate depolymerase
MNDHPIIRFILKLSTCLLVLPAFLLLPAGASEKNLLPASPGNEKPMLRHVIHHDGIEREYFAFVPRNAGHRKLPVVISLHGYGTTATGFQSIYALNAHAQKHGYIIVYPQSTHFMGALGTDPAAEPFLVSTWNDLASNFTPAAKGPHCTEDRLQYPCPPECGSCNHCAWVSCHDDVGFLTRVLDEVKNTFATDIERYYLLGNSNGALMAMRLSCDLGERFAATAALIAQMPPGFECAPTRSLPLLHLFGDLDDTVGHDGTPTSDGWITASAADTASTWAIGMGCKGEPEPWGTAITDANQLTCTAYTDCPGRNHQVVSCMDTLAGHEWRGQRLTEIPANCVGPEQRASLPQQPACTMGIDSSALWGMDLVWQFLSQYQRR